MACYRVKITFFTFTCLLCRIKLVCGPLVASETYVKTCLQAVRLVCPLWATATTKLVHACSVLDHYVLKRRFILQYLTFGTATKNSPLVNEISLTRNEKLKNCFPICESVFFYTSSFLSKTDCCCRRHSSAVVGSGIISNMQVLIPMAHPASIEEFTA